MQIAVCDDNFEEMQLVIAELNKVSIQLNTEYTIYEFQNKQDLFDTLKDKEIEVVLLDIDMPGESGIEIANEICVLYPMLSIIFVTNHDELVFTALRCNPFRFVRKNHMKEEIFEAMSSLEIKLSKEMFIFDFTRGKDSYKFRI